MKLRLRRRRMTDRCRCGHPWSAHWGAVGCLEGHDVRDAGCRCRRPAPSHLRRQKADEIREAEMDLVATIWDEARRMQSAREKEARR